MDNLGLVESLGHLWKQSCAGTEMKSDSKAIAVQNSNGFGSVCEQWIKGKSMEWIMGELFVEINSLKDEISFLREEGVKKSNLVDILWSNAMRRGVEPHLNDNNCVDEIEIDKFAAKQTLMEDVSLNDKSVGDTLEDKEHITTSVFQNYLDNDDENIQVEEIIDNDLEQSLQHERKKKISNYAVEFEKISKRCSAIIEQKLRGKDIDELLQETIKDRYESVKKCSSDVLSKEPCNQIISIHGGVVIHF